VGVTNSGAKLLFALTSDSAVYCSTNGGRHWTSIGQGLPQAGALCLAVIDSSLFVGTDGAGIWKRRLSEILSSLTPQFGSMRLAIQNIPGYGVVGTGGKVSLYDKNEAIVSDQNTDSSGVAFFSGVSGDSGYVIRVTCVNSNPSKIYGNEYWGSLGGISVVGAETTAVTFVRNAPYTSNINLYNANTNALMAGNIPFGTPIRVSIEITNPSSPGSITQLVRSGLTLDRNKLLPYDFQDTSDSRSMLVGTKDTFNFVLTPPDSGKYSHEAAALIRQDGSYAVTEGGLWGTIPTFTVDPPPPSTVLVTVQASPAVCTFRVDDSTYSTSHSFAWSIGSSHVISTITPQLFQSGIRYDWNRWSDGDSLSHKITTPASNTTYRATFDTSYYLTMAAGNGGSVVPSSGWFSSGMKLPIVARANAGWRLSQWIGLGKGSYSGTDTSAVISMDSVISETAAFEPATGVSDLRMGIPSTFVLNGNYPNPFNPTTTIRFGVPTRASVKVTVYSILGEFVSQLVDGEVIPGYHEVRFDGTHLSSGVYICRILSGSFVQTKSLLLLK